MALDKYRDIKFGSFLCKDGMILYKIVRKPNANLYLEYREEDKYYIVTCNGSISEADIKQYVLNNYEWIMNWYKNIDNPYPWMIFGNKVPVKVIIGNEHRVEYDGNQINVYLRHKRDYKDAAKQFYKQFATAYLMPRTQEFINRLGLKGQFGRVSWATWYHGLCHANKTIDYSAKLVQYSKEYIDYVIYHEIAHFTHMNHKKEFWQLVATYCPNYKELEKQSYKMMFANHMW
ncbi:MAG: M48 family metallopeptidase [Mycoplasmoidaceae bacterium]